MRIRLSELAIFKLERLSEFLIENWSEESNRKFLKKLDSKLSNIQITG